MRERLHSLRASLDESLFLESPRPSRRPSRGKRTALTVSLLALSVVLQLLRIGLPTAFDSLWAEDGPIFLQAALFENFGDAVTAPYAGYLVLVPRLIAEVASLFAVEDAAAAISVLSAAVVGLSGLAVWHAAGSLVRNRYLRGVLAALTVLAPIAGLESIDSAAYVGWYMLFATFWLLLWRPRTGLGAGLGALFVLATALSTPGVWFFLPLAALRALAIRSGRDAAIVGAYAVGAAVQIPVVAANQGESVDPGWANEVWVAYVQRVIDGAAFGQELGGSLWAHLGVPFLLLTALGAVALLVVLWRTSGPVGRRVTAIAAPISVALFVISAYQRDVADALGWGVGSFNGSGGRYAIVPALLLVSAALVMLEDSPRRRRGALGLSPPAAAAAALLLIGIVTSFPQGEGDHRGGPAWESSLKAAASSCRADDLREASVPTSPPPFGLQIPCERISTLADADPAR